GGRPPAPSPGRLGAAGLRPVPGRQRRGRGVRALRTPGPARNPAGRRLGGPVLPGHRPRGADPAGFRAVTDPDRVAALASLALVGVADGGGARRPADRQGGRSPRARLGVTGGAPAVLLTAMALVPRPPDWRYQGVDNPFDLRPFEGARLGAYQAALAVAVLGVLVGAGGVGVRVHRARGIE